MILILNIWFVLFMLFTLIFPRILEITEMFFEFGVIFALVVLRRYLVIAVTLDSKTDQRHHVQFI